MSAIPFEILTLIFKPLVRNDLIQCQLVCKSWNQASLKLLYSNIHLFTAESCQRFVRTIKSSLQLGKYLEIFRAGPTTDLIKEEGREEYEEIEFNNWDRHDLLDTIIDHCPNVLKLINKEATSSFFIKIMMAASLGQLSRLQHVSSPDEDNFYYYAHTALVLKKSLNILKIPDGVFPNSFGTEAYPFLCKNLNQFPCLQTLKISCYSESYLSDCDTLIDNCKNLTELVVRRKSNLNVIFSTKSTKIFRPHPKIETLECTWSIINAEDQITYIMQKFPNLSFLVINDADYNSLNYDSIIRFSANTLIKFLSFISSLKRSDVSLISKVEDCVKPWVSVINEKLTTIDISISVYTSDYGNPNTFSTQFNGKQLVLTFFSYTDYHIRLLSEIGKKVRSLSWEQYHSPLATVENINHIIELIKLCPSLQNLRLKRIQKFFYLGSVDYRGFELRCLNLGRYDHTMGSLERISFIFPNLKMFHLFIYIKNSIKETITIDMPYNSLDILRCSVIDDYSFKTDVPELYIRIKSEAGLQFYSATKHKLQQINEDQHKHLPLDIICRNLTRLKIDCCDFINFVTYI